MHFCRKVFLGYKMHLLGGGLNPPLHSTCTETLRYAHGRYTETSVARAGKIVGSLGRALDAAFHQQVCETDIIRKICTWSYTMTGSSCTGHETWNEPAIRIDETQHLFFHRGSPSSWHWQGWKSTQITMNILNYLNLLKWNWIYIINCTTTKQY